MFADSDITGVLIGGTVLIVLASIPIFIWAQAYSTCTDASCTTGHAQLVRNFFDLPVCICTEDLSR